MRIIEERLFIIKCTHVSFINKIKGFYSTQVIPFLCLLGMSACITIILMAEASA